MATTIALLPKKLQLVPETADEWRTWRDRVTSYRMLARDRAERDKGARADLIERAAADPAFDMIVFGAVFEPRPRVGRDQGWYPMIPFHFQVDLIRWIEGVVAAIPGTSDAALGRGDGVIEKARGMAGSWTCCAYAANRWRFADGFLTGFMSYKQEVVDKANLPDTLFVKIEGYLGLDRRVPEFRKLDVGGSSEIVPIRSPDWLIPEGYDPKLHNMELTIAHPYKTNVISGYSTGDRTGVGARQTIFILDEAAKFTSFPTVWQSIAAVTDHRIALSSADIRFGSGFRDLARVAREAVAKNEPGPSFIRLHPDLHPERDALWRAETEARHAGSKEAAESMAREFDLDYDAGAGNTIYRRAQEIDPVPLTFNPSNEMLDFCIDPGIRDMNAFHLVKYDPGKDRYGVLASYANNGLPAEFYASLVVAAPLYNEYAYGDDEEQIMEWFERYGRNIRYWVGDPAGKQRGQATATSFYDEFRLATGRLSDGKRPIQIWCSDQSQYKWQDPRIAALRWMLDRTDFNNTPEVIRTLQAVREHRFSATRSDRETTTVSRLPVRTWGHDRVTALEFYAAHRKHGGAMEAAFSRSPAPARVSMSGKPLRKKERGYVRG